MSRIAASFARTRAEGRAALVTFITAGDPTPGDTAAILDALVAGGADVIELGMPFTDPMADGPAIQAANLRSLGAGTRTRDVFAIVDAFRERHPQVPLILMGYANSMTRPTPDAFAKMAGAAGVDGIIIVDIPSEEAQEVAPFAEQGVSVIRLATPTTDAARLPAVLDGASGFLYYVSVAGITGLQQAAQTSIEAAVARLKAATDLPVCVGFGVRTPEQAAAIGEHADGVVIGSAIIDIIAAHGAEAPPKVQTFVAALRGALETKEKVA